LNVEQRRGVVLPRGHTAEQPDRARDDRQVHHLVVRQTV
jgi:hypothetical protein